MTPKPKKLILDMSASQHKKLAVWLLENGVDLSGDIEFALLGQPHMERREIDVLLLTKKQWEKVYKVTKEF